MPAPYEGFARRLHQALDFVGFDRGRLRTGKLAAHYDVSRETARKWLSGLALPELERLIALSVHTAVSFEWLATGRGDMTTTRLGIRDGDHAAYMDRDEARLIGLVRQLPPNARKAWITLLENK